MQLAFKLNTGGIFNTPGTAFTRLYLPTQQAR